VASSEISLKTSNLPPLLAPCSLLIPGRRGCIPRFRPMLYACVPDSPVPRPPFSSTLTHA
jgi:hypothetical protein